ncbi:hypothetical protein [Streptomyces sp. Root1310]|uniref:hypothetical protein n=1 Tax=Streptomyces sp. Root1310 TaxID=1736452 RepID=UPI000A92CE1E|nr:hypothetical protein [Streptomyces sp. Root1310]
MRAPFGFRKASRLHAPSFSRLFALPLFAVLAVFSVFFRVFSRRFPAFPGLPSVVP